MYNRFLSGEAAPVPSLTSLYPAADWYEREAPEGPMNGDVDLWAADGVIEYLNDAIKSSHVFLVWSAACLIDASSAYAGETIRAAVSPSAGRPHCLLPLRRHCGDLARWRGSHKLAHSRAAASCVAARAVEYSSSFDGRKDSWLGDLDSNQD
jgi:hypothetical protein